MKLSTNQFVKSFILLFNLFLFNFSNISAQARLVLNNGGLIVLNGGNSTNSIYLVLDNPNANAMTRITSGHIISENEFNKIKWNIGTTAGTYTIPYGIGTSIYIPNSMTTSGAAGSGNLTFSTYTGNWQNSAYLPTGVTNFVNNHGLDNSWAALDRFWRIEPTGYTTKPALANLQFTYRDIEHSVASNVITEAGLVAQRYNFALNSWDDYMPGGTANTATNVLTVASLPSAELHTWWVLVDAASVLPVEITSFNAKCNGSSVSLTWQTASESNNNYFVLERSADGIHFEAIATIPTQNGNSSITQYYSATDNQPLATKAYYRLKQVDINEHYSYSSVTVVTCNDAVSIEPNITIYPNPAVDYMNVNIKNLKGTKQLTIYNAIAQEMAKEQTANEDDQLQFNVMSFAKGTYILRIDVDGAFYQAIKFVKK